MRKLGMFALAASMFAAEAGATPSAPSQKPLKQLPTANTPEDAEPAETKSLEEILFPAQFSRMAEIREEGQSLIKQLNSTRDKIKTLLDDVPALQGKTEEQKEATIMGAFRNQIENDPESIPRTVEKDGTIVLQQCPVQVYATVEQARLKEGNKVHTLLGDILKAEHEVHSIQQQLTDLQAEYVRLIREVQTGMQRFMTPLQSEPKPPKKPRKNRPEKKLPEGASVYV